MSLFDEVRRVLLAGEPAVLLTVLDGERAGAKLLVREGGEAVEQRIRDGLDEDVDLAAAREADRERLVVGDSVGEELRGRTLEDLASLAVDLVLDAAA